MSPTPLDPYNITVHGVEYESAALEYMQAELYLATKDLVGTHPRQLENAEGEIEFQHRHRSQKNDEAMTRWREAAATDPGRTVLSHAEAEGVLQVRAGMSKMGAVVRLLARNPEMGAIEISKATRPFCGVAYQLARSATLASIVTFSESSGTDLIFSDTPPYRSIVDERHSALILKSSIALASVDGVDLEIKGRESAIVYNPVAVPAIPEAQVKLIAGTEVAMVPIDITSYVSVANPRSL